MMKATLSAPAACSPGSTSVTARSFLSRYRSFLLTRSTIVTGANGALLAAGVLASLVFQSAQAADILWIAAILIGGAPIWLGAVDGLLHKDLTSDVMASAAILGALLIGEYSAGALVVFMLRFGELLEDLTVARADNALEDLARLIPSQVTLLRAGEWALVPIAQVKPGDSVLVHNGERVPVDGIVTGGRAAIDESTITGESVPVDKTVGDHAYAATMNTAGTLEIRAEKLGRDTTLGTIVKLVEEAQKSQAPVQRLADRYAQYLVPITFAIAVLVYLMTGQAIRSVAVLVVVCPCALILATPTALAAAIGNAARHNAIVKTGAAMEALHAVDVVAFDKTGTLTSGKPRVTSVIALDSYAEDDLLRYAASAEMLSEHPLARAIVEEATSRHIGIPRAEVTDVLTGLGVRAVSDRRDILVGSRTLLAASGVVLAGKDEDRALALEKMGCTVAPIAINCRAVGLFALSDAIRPEAAQLVQAIKSGGVKRTILISGDNQAAVRAVAGALGIDEYHAQVLPDQKLAIIKKLQAQGLKVAYVGDGVNDAPALATADVGIAMGAAGTDIAIETAKIALMGNDMRNLPHLLALSRETMRTVRVNVVFSMSMNLLAVVLSSLGIIGPGLGALMHEVAAIPVLLYSARLVAFKPRL